MDTSPGEIIVVKSVYYKLYTVSIQNVSIQETYVDNRYRSNDDVMCLVLNFNNESIFSRIATTVQKILNKDWEGIDLYSDKVKYVRKKIRVEALTGIPFKYPKLDENNSLAVGEDILDCREARGSRSGILQGSADYLEVDIAIENTFDHMLRVEVQRCTLGTGANFKYIGDEVFPDYLLVEGKITYDDVDKFMMTF